MDLTHHHGTLSGVVGGNGGANGAGVAGASASGMSSNAGVLGELGVQDLLLDRAPSPSSARMAYTSEKHPRFVLFLFFEIFFKSFDENFENVLILQIHIQ